MVTGLLWGAPQRVGATYLQAVPVVVVSGV